MHIIQVIITYDKEEQQIFEDFLFNLNTLSMILHIFSTINSLLLLLPKIMKLLDLTVNKKIIKRKNSDKWT